MFRGAFVITIALSLVSSPAAASGTDQSAIAALAAWCAQPAPRFASPVPLAPLVALADGRSAREFADALRIPGCYWHTNVSGNGDDEIVALSVAGSGAILWVDNGWWRAADIVDAGYIEPQLVASRSIDNGREVLIGICRCGSGGNSGIIGLRLVGRSATTILHMELGSQVMAEFLSGDHILVTGRVSTERPFAWDSNCCVPGGYEWLYERSGPGFILVAERQAVTPYFALSAFFGEVKRAVPASPDVVDPEARDVGLALQRLGPIEVSYNGVSAIDPFAVGKDELRRWEALPAALRSSSGVDSLYWGVTLYRLKEHNTIEAPIATAAVGFRRDADGWRISSVAIDREIVRGRR